MTIDWQLRESGPTDAERTVLLLPGGMCSAGSYAELMAEPALARVRLVAVSLPGHAGARRRTTSRSKATPNTWRTWPPR
jgi:pimeloyl-ACP methyl ester carboxylesterase